MKCLESQNAFVTKKLLEEKNIGFAYRENPDSESDSGWRFFEGTEEQEYVDNPNNIVLCSIEEVIKMDGTIKQILENEYMSAFEKNNNGIFTEVKDFKFDIK